jgi:glycosyltransferase involved in cell wall biosynthesis
MNKISIIIPVYNVEKYLSTCLDSVINQTYQNLEIILVNDGSTDSCPQICDTYSAIDHRIKVIHKKNGGLSDARNAGYQEVTGDYLAFVDSDDKVALDLYQNLIEASILYNADIVECGFLKFQDEKDLEKTIGQNKVEEFETEKALELLLIEDLKQVVWNKLYKSDVVNNLLFEKNKIHEDEFWTYQIFARAKKIVRVNKPLYFYRQQNESIMAEKYSVKRLAGIEAREERIEFVKQKFPKLTYLAVQSFWHAALYNYLLIVENPDVDVDFKFRKSIVKKIKEQVKPNYSAHWNIKERIWLTFFFANPRVCSKLRIFLRDWGLKNSN